MSRTFAVIGLGIFGSTIARQLSLFGNEVIGIDKNPEAVNAVAEHITQAAIADARDETVLRNLGVHDCEGVIISIGEDLEANLLATLIVKGMKKPKVWAEALNRNHEQILRKLGTDFVVHPEYEMGLRLANTIMYPEVMDYISLGNDQYMVEVHTSEKLAGNTLGGLSFETLEVHCLLIKHQGKALLPPPSDYKLQVDDRLVLFGTMTNLRKISKYL